MPPKRTRGGAAKASASRGAPANDESSHAEPTTTQPSTTDTTAGHPSSAAQPSTAATDMPAPSADASSPSTTRAPRKNLTPRTTIRRSKEVRDANLAAEVAKEAAHERGRLAQEAEKRRAAERLERLRKGWNHETRGRGRGGYMGGGGGRPQIGASGPHSQGAPEGKAKVYVPHRKQGSTKASEQKPRVAKDEGAAGPSTSSSTRSGRRRVVIEDDDDVVMGESTEIKKEEGGYVSSDDDEAYGGPRKDVDHINLVSDEEDEGAGQERAFSLVPIRLRRVEHRERNAGINVEPSSGLVDDDKEHGAAIEEDDQPDPANTAGKLKSKSRTKDVEVVQTTRRWRGVYDDDDEEVEVKAEPTDDVQISTSTVPPTRLASSPTASRLSPETSRRVAKDKAKAASGSKAGFLAKKKPAFQTPEEEFEWQRWQQDLQTLVEELGHVDVDATEADGRPAASFVDVSGVRPKSEAIYLFQFPPVLPDLSLASEAVKQESNELGSTATTAAAPSSPQQQAKRAAASKSKQTSEQPLAAVAPIKIEDDAAAEKSAGAAAGPRLASGMTGKLRVHQSGKVTLDWGGTSLQLNMGLDASFLQDAVIAKVPRTDAGSKGTQTGGTAEAGIGAGGQQGEAYALGPVRGKFVVTPDWDAVI